MPINTTAVKLPQLEYNTWKVEARSKEEMKIRKKGFSDFKGIVSISIFCMGNSVRKNSIYNSQTTKYCLQIWKIIVFYNRLESWKPSHILNPTSRDWNKIKIAIARLHFNSFYVEFEIKTNGGKELLNCFIFVAISLPDLLRKIFFPSKNLAGSFQKHENRQKHMLWMKFLYK